MIDGKIRELRAVATQYETRRDGDTPHITGYFAVFNSNYEIGPGMSESIAPGAFAKSLANNDDVRALVNHDSTLVAGRTKAGTTVLKEDAQGLWADIAINPKDTECMNAYYRVERGDVDQASFGFEIIRQDTEVKPDGSVHWTLLEVRLYEISICTFPAYNETNISARTKERDDLKARELSAWKERMKGVLSNGAQGTTA